MTYASSIVDVDATLIRLIRCHEYIARCDMSLVIVGYVQEWCLKVRALANMSVSITRTKRSVLLIEIVTEDQYHCIAM